jgi:predicted DNA-binding ribbon-helix-helix protein
MNCQYRTTAIIFFKGTSLPTSPYRITEDTGETVREPRMMKSPIVKRTVRIHGHKTTVSVEDPFWSDLKKIAHTQHATISKVIADIDNARQHGNLSSAIRLFVLDQVRNPSVAGASG